MPGSLLGPARGQHPQERQRPDAVALGHCQHGVSFGFEQANTAAARIGRPALIVQGEADPLGTRTEVATYGLSRSIELHWIAGADHDLVPKAGPERSKAQARDLAWADAADAVARFAMARFAVAPPDVATSVAAGCQPLNRRL